MVILPVIACASVPNGDGGIHADRRAVLAAPAAGAPAAVVPRSPTAASAPVSAHRHVAATSASAAPPAVRAGPCTWRLAVKCGTVAVQL